MVPIAQSESRQDLERWTFALEAMRIPFELTPADEESGEMVLWVRREHAARAHRAVVELDIEDAEPPSAPLASARPRAQPRAITGSIALVWLLMLGTLLQLYIPGWEAHGALLGSAVRDGEWYRALTAITLHSGLVHLLSNSAFLVIFAVTAIRGVGTGVSTAVAVAAGALANVASALAHPADFRAIGASGAVFALLGLVAALAVHRRPTNAAVRWAPGVGAALGLFAFTGLARETDVIAHFGGGLLGFAFGLLVTRLDPLGRAGAAQIQWAAGLATLGGLVLAWALALA